MYSADNEGINIRNECSDAFSPATKENFGAAQRSDSDDTSYGSLIDIFIDLRNTVNQDLKKMALLRQEEEAMFHHRDRENSCAQSRILQNK